MHRNNSSWKTIVLEESFPKNPRLPEYDVRIGFGKLQKLAVPSVLLLLLLMLFLVAAVALLLLRLREEEETEDRQLMMEMARWWSAQARMDGREERKKQEGEGMKEKKGKRKKT